MTPSNGWPVALLIPFLVLALLSGCASVPASPVPPPTLTPYPPDLYIGLGEAAAPLAELVSSAYENDSDRSAPRFVSASDETLLGELQAGKLEAVIVHHLPAGSQHWFSPIALDGLVFLTHPELALQDLTRSDVQQIFAGMIDNWAAVGGPDLAISVLSRETGTGARAILEERIMGNLPLTGLAQIAPDDRFMVERVTANEGAIGYSMMASAGDQARVMYEGTAPTPETISRQIYPLTTPIYFVANEEPSGDMRAFLAWLQSTAGQDVLDEKYGRLR